MQITQNAKSFKFEKKKSFLTCQSLQTDENWIGLLQKWDKAAQSRFCLKMKGFLFGGILQKDLEQKQNNKRDLKVHTALQQQPIKRRELGWTIDFEAFSVSKLNFLAKMKEICKKT